VFEKSPCPFDLPAGTDDTIACGFVIVPEDHNDPEGATIRIALAILKDQSGTHQPDPVMVLHGGPGEKTLANALSLAPLLSPLHPNRDLIIFDQRGVGLSEPALECPEWIDAQLALLDEPDPNTGLPIVFEAWMACRDRLVSEGHNLSAYNTAQNAADVNAIRIALGYDQVNLYGASYGSHLAQAVMRDYPEAIRSSVIASVWPLEKSFTVDLSMATSDGILRLLEACATDDACNSAYPDLKNMLYEVVDRLNADPVPMTLSNPLTSEQYPAVMTGDTVVSNLVVFLYLTDVIPVLPQAIFDVSNGDFELMTQLSSTKLALLDMMSRGVLFPVLCTDDLIGLTPEDLLRVMASIPQQLRGSVDPELLVEYSIFGICEQWPAEEAEPWVNEPLVSDIPTLVLGSEFDPVTPPKFGQLVASYLPNSYFFEFPGIGHNITVNECARNIAGAFIGDPTHRLDASCVAELPDVAFTVPVETTEIEFEPYENEDSGLKGIVPAGWTEVQAGIFARSSPTVDMAVIQMAFEPRANAEELLAGLTDGYGLESIPEIASERQANGLSWSLFSFKVQGVPRDVALAESEGGTLILIMRSAADERDELYEVVFLPAVDALMLVKEKY
jgi:pimeloyl-ACP methyl ester carboxylesterase